MLVETVATPTLETLQAAGGFTCLETGTGLVDALGPPHIRIE